MQMAPQVSTHPGLDLYFAQCLTIVFILNAILCRVGRNDGRYCKTVEKDLLVEIWQYLLYGEKKKFLLQAAYLSLSHHSKTTVTHSKTTVIHTVNPS